MNAILASALLLAALAGSASATCWCEYLKEFPAGCSGSPVAVPCYTFTADKTTDTSSTNQIGMCDYYSQTTPEPSLQTTVAAKCTNDPNCKGFVMSSEGTKLKVCYYKSTTYKVYKDFYDNRCMGLWVKNSMCQSPPPPPPPPSDDCCNAYATYSQGAVDKCKNCRWYLSSIWQNPDTCCKCKAATDYDPTNCLDCVYTAHNDDKAKCPSCYYKYKPGTNGLTRCHECVALAKGEKNWYQCTSPKSCTSCPTKADLCLDFCSSYKEQTMPGSSTWTYIDDPSQCLDCTKDGEVQQGWFRFPRDNMGRITNVNGECPAPATVLPTRKTL